MSAAKKTSKSPESAARHSLCAAPGSEFGCQVMCEFGPKQYRRCHGQTVGHCAALGRLCEHHTLLALIAGLNPERDIPNAEVSSGAKNP